RSRRPFRHDSGSFDAHHRPLAVRFRLRQTGARQFQQSAQSQTRYDLGCRRRSGDQSFARGGMHLDLAAHGADDGRPGRAGFSLRPGRFFRAAGSDGSERHPDQCDAGRVQHAAAAAAGRRAGARGPDAPRAVAQDRAHRTFRFYHPDRAVDDADVGSHHRSADRISVETLPGSLLDYTIMETIVSGMRPTGKLHLGHYHGALINWLRLQERFQCYFFVADWHALTTDYAAPQGIRESTIEMVMDWLAVGLDPKKSVIFRQSRVKEHAELHLLY